MKTLVPGLLILIAILAITLQLTNPLTHPRLFLGIGATILVLFYAFYFSLWKMSQED